MIRAEIFPWQVQHAWPILVAVLIVAGVALATLLDHLAWQHAQQRIRESNALFQRIMARVDRARARQGVRLAPSSACGCCTLQFASPLRVSVVVASRWSEGRVIEERCEEWCTECASLRPSVVGRTAQA